MRPAILATLAMLLLAGCEATAPGGGETALAGPASGPFVPVTAVAMNRLADPPPPDLPPRPPSTPIPGFRAVSDAPVTTIPLGADTASYGMARRVLRMGRWPAADAVRPEEFLNAFAFAYPPATRAQPLAPFVAVLPAPWDASRRLLHIGIRALDPPRGERPALNLTFLIDASVSMFAADRMPIIVEGIRALMPSLGERDRLSIISYAAGTRPLLEQMRGDRRVFIEAALDELRPGGGSPGAGGMETAYGVAGRNLDAGAINQVILVTDGDFGLGAASPQALEAMIRARRERGIRLGTITVGLDAPADTTMRGLAHAGGGVHGFAADGAGFLRLVNEEIARNRAIAAQAVRLEVEFNSFRVQEYRLVGFTSRPLGRADFEADQLGAGEIPAGRALTAVFELAAPVTAFRPFADPRQAERAILSASGDGSDPGNDYAALRIRHTPPAGGESRMLRRAVTERDWRPTLAAASAESRFAASVVGFALMLRRAEGINWPYAAIADTAAQAIGDNPDGQRPDFVALVRAAAALRP